jgi:hypothetical protein
MDKSGLIEFARALAATALISSTGERQRCRQI